MRSARAMVDVFAGLAMMILAARLRERSRCASPALPCAENTAARSIRAHIATSPRSRAPASATEQQIDIFSSGVDIFTMSAPTLQPRTALPRDSASPQKERRVEKWNTSPGGPLEMHAQASSGENGGQTSSGEHAAGSSGDRAAGSSGDHAAGSSGDRGPNDDETRAAADGNVVHERVAEGNSDARVEASPTKSIETTPAQEALRQRLSTKQLQKKYEEVFGVPTKVHNKDWILSKISDRVKIELPDDPEATQTKAGVKAEKQAAGAPRKSYGKHVDIPVGQVRCSRNDGKNWRCSEMASPGHKHCQKHMRWTGSAKGASKSQGRNHQAIGAKRPHWMTSNVSLPSGAAPSGMAKNDLLEVAASALDELHKKEETEAQQNLQGVSGATNPMHMFGFNPQMLQPSNVNQFQTCFPMMPPNAMVNPFAAMWWAAGMGAQPPAPTPVARDEMLAPQAAPTPPAHFQMGMGGMDPATCMAMMMMMASQQ